MPKVPVLTQNQRLRPGNPTGFQSTSSARSRGSAISQFGSGLANVGNRLAQEAKKNKSKMGPLRRANLSADLGSRLGSLRARIAKEGDDGANDLETYNREATTIIDEMKASGQWDDIEGFDDITSAVMNDDGVKVSASSVVKSKDFLKQAEATAKSNFHAEVAANPDKVDLISVKAEAVLAQTYANFGIDKSKSELQLRQFRGQLLESAVREHTHNEEYKKALDVLNNNRQFFTDQDAFLKERNRIQNQAIKAETRQYTNWQRDARIKEAELEEESAAVLQTALELKTRAENPYQMDIADEYVKEATLSGDLTRAHQKIYRSQSKQDLQEASDGTVRDITDRFLGGKTSKTSALREIRRSIPNRRLTEDDATGLIRLVNTSSTYSNTSKQLVSATLKEIRTEINPQGTVFNFGKAEKAKQAARASRHFTELLVPYGRSPSPDQIRKAKNMMYKSFKPSAQFYMQGVETSKQESSSEVETILIDLKKQKRAGKLDTTTFIKKYETGKARMNLLRKEEEADRKLTEDEFIPTLEELTRPQTPTKTIPFR